MTEKWQRILGAVYIFFERENVYYLINLPVGKMHKLRQSLVFSIDHAIRQWHFPSPYSYLIIFQHSFPIPLDIFKIVTESTLSYLVCFGTVV